VAASHFSSRTPLVKQPPCGREPVQVSLVDFVNSFRGKAGMPRCPEATVVRLCDCNQCRRAAEIKPPFGHCMEIGNVAREVVHQTYAQPAGLGEDVEQE
jgi:hypothetical protein